MKFNKFILFLLLTANIISFTACGNNNDDTTKATATTSATSQATTQATAQVQATTKATAQIQSQTPTEAVTVASTQAPTERPTQTQTQDNTQSTTPTQANPDVYSVVDSAMTTLAQGEAYKSATKDEQIAMVQACLNDLENQGYILKGSIYYSETHYSMFNFRYQNGDLGAFTFE